MKGTGGTGGDNGQETALRSFMAYNSRCHPQREDGRTMFVDKDGMHTVPLMELEQTTLIFDRKRQMQVMEISGVVVLPVGAEVELVKPNLSARVTGVRLRSGMPASGTSKGLPAGVILDVEVPQEWWDKTGY